MKKKLLIGFAFLATIPLSAQNYNKTEHGVKTQTQGMEIEVQFYTPSTVRVIKYPENTELKKQSLSVIKQPENVSYQLSSQGDMVYLSSDKVNVALNTVTGKVSFADKQNSPLLTEKDFGTQFSAIKDGPNDSYKVRQAFLLNKEEAIYGLGQQQAGRMNQRNQILPLQNQNMRVCIPMIQSEKGYGIFWDQYSISKFEDNPQEMSMESVGVCADYYFMYGGNADGVIAQMRELTGQSPMLPLWAYGFLQSRERYKTQEEPVAVITKYREIGVPIDCIIQDWQYWGKDSLWNAMAFDHNTYPDPQSMVDKVHKMNAKMMIVAWPGFGPLTPQYRELKEKNMLINFDTWPPQSGTKPYDVYNPEAKDIYWKYLSKGVFSKGFDGWWLDSSEPDHINIKESDYDQPTYLGTFRSVHNAFPLMTVGGVYDHQRMETAQKRVVILTRSAFAGQQRYGANTWSGDVVSDWEVFKKQISGGLNFTLCGIPYWNTDIGGFFAGRYVKGGGARNPGFQELYVRWLQFGTFMPMMRSHGTDIPREIYQFGKRGDWAFDAQEKFINLRYSLLPYIYSTAWGVTHNSGSFMRALVMDFAKDKKALDINNEYMFGRSFLVAPVTEKGAKTQSVYLPAGTIWYDFWTNEQLQGGNQINKETPINIMPLYIKAGSIIPFGPKVQYSSEKKWDNLEIRIYTGTNGEFTLYEDEKDNYNYEKGAYSTITMKWNEQDGTLIIGERQGKFNGMLKNRKFKVTVINAAKTISSKNVTYNGDKMTIKL